MLGEPHPEVLAPPTAVLRIITLSLPLPPNPNPTPTPIPKQVRRLLLCSGRLYFELEAARLGFGVGFGVGVGVGVGVGLT